MGVTYICNPDVGVSRHEIEQLLDDRVKVFHSFDLTRPQLFQLLAIEEALFGRCQPAPYDMVVQMFEDAMYAADARPLLGWLFHLWLAFAWLRPKVPR
jgi:hypothetical protein